MVNTTRKILTDAIREVAHPLTDRRTDYEPLLEMIGDAHFVLLGEASHGTHEFYDTRAIITQRLITEKGFTAVAVEADWPDAYRVNRYVQGISGDATAREALDSFQRFPLWMWRNQDVLVFLEWLRTYNSHLNESEDKKVGFYGLDLYSLYHSIEAVINYLEAVDPEAAQRARYRYGCFEHTGEDAQDYGYAANFQLTSSCEQDVINQLVELQQHTMEYVQRDGQNAEDEFFYAEQNARVVKNAEEYYRSMFGGRISSWNLRDQHMAGTLDALMTYLTQQDDTAKIVVWEHNSHLGDARATSMGDEGELNVGQLVRERYPNEAILVGFSTYSGTVTAASAWDGPHERKRVRPALPESYEALFHETALPRFFLSLRNDNQAIQALRNRHLERAIGVIYLPHSERVSHYFYARLPEQFNGIIHIDETHAVEPLDRSERWEAGDLPETAPTAL
jgi:erythromycin esterase-like protein